MLDAPDYVIDSKIHEALGAYFHGVTLKKIVCDCSILAGVRKQNGALVDIFVPSYAASRDDDAVEAISKQFVAYEKLNRRDLQAAVRCYTSRAFRKSPALAMLNCPVDVVDDAFDTLDCSTRLAHYVEALSALSALHDAGIVHGAVSEKALRREERHGSLRLCDTGFSGGRQTTVVEQPIAYQSCKVINTSQPEIIDDVYAAGMLGYRLLLGPHGPEQVLTGDSDSIGGERLTGAILGENRSAPDGTSLFPEGHASSEQIARVLARMIGRLPHAAPYSSATTALKALRSVIENPGKAEPAESVTFPAADKSNGATTGTPAKTRHQGSLSRTAAVALFCGCFATVSSMVYFQQQAHRLNEGYSIAVFQLNETRNALKSAQTESEILRKGMTTFVDAASDLRAADRAVITADLSGATLASQPAAKALDRAQKAHDVADRAFIEENWARVSSASAVATKEATQAANAIASIRGNAITMRETVATRYSAALRATGLRSDLNAALEVKLAEAEAAFGDLRYSTAIGVWQKSVLELDSIIETQKSRAISARKDAWQQIDRVGKGEGAAQIRGMYLVQRANQAFDAGAFAESVAVYRRAEYTLDSLPDAAPGAHIDERTAQLSQALSLVTGQSR